MKHKDKQRFNSKFRQELLSRETPAEKQFELILQDLSLHYLKQKGWLAGHKTFCISDFYLPKPFKLAIEIDGLIHNDPLIKFKDKQKEQYLLEERKIKTIRFTNQQVLETPQLVAATLRSTLAAGQTSGFAE